MLTQVPYHPSPSVARLRYTLPLGRSRQSHNHALGQQARSSPFTGLDRHSAPQHSAALRSAAPHTSTALPGDGPSSPSHAVQPHCVFTTGLTTVRKVTTKHGDRSGLIQESPLAESSTELNYNSHCEDSRGTSYVHARETPRGASDL